MNKLFVPYKESLILKDLGFNEFCKAQYEALEFIYKKGYRWTIKYEFCKVRTPDGEIFEEIGENAVFEILYKISQYGK